MWRKKEMKNYLNKIKIIIFLSFITYGSIVRQPRLFSYSSETNKCSKNQELNAFVDN